MLDDDFLEAYAHGLVIDGCDGIRRRHYPRLLTYSLDYQEKCVLYSEASPLQLNVSQNSRSRYKVYWSLPLSTLPYTNRSLASHGDAPRHGSTQDTCTSR
jgi:hypothetical protein